MEDENAEVEEGAIAQEQEDAGVAAQADDAAPAPDALAQAVSRYRDVVAAMPGLVPEMVQGSTVDEIDASAQSARQAYEEVAKRITAAHEAQVPAGNPARSQFDTHASALKPEAKIALGLKGR